jgi:hypothetical protein
VLLSGPVGEDGDSEKRIKEGDIVTVMCQD